jgi:histidinol-phosphate/aromatic aminotransferase/cobyric acid decarboxylase-like protein/CTP:molybdopterin cytidylyltransferase MocA
MKAIILAAGYGNRMRPLTDHVHKTLLTVAGQTIIGRIVDGLVDNGIRDLVVVTGYRAEELARYLSAAYPHLSIQYVHNDRYRETNNIYSMALAFEHTVIDDDLVLIESDLVYQPEVIARLLSSREKNVALVDRYARGMDGTVVTIDNGVISSVVPPHLQDDTFDFSDKYKTLNIYKFSMEFCNSTFKKLLTYYAKVINDNCYYELILGILIYMQQETVHAEILSGEKWAEVDDPNDLRVAEFMFNEQARPAILGDGFGGYWNYDILDFAFIRNMYFPTPSVLSEMRNSLPDLLHNYGSRQGVLDTKMAWFLLCEPAHVHALGGASQIYPMLRERLVGQNVLIPQPSFGEYPRIFPDALTYGDSVGMDLDEIEARASSCSVVVFVNPNNPTGTTLESTWIAGLAGRHRQALVIVDESFIEFSAVGSIMPLCDRAGLENVVVIKSLSKSMGMPGLRLGYVYSRNREFMAFVGDRIPIWNMNSLAEFTLEIVLKHRNILAQSFGDTIRDREVFAAALANLPGVERVFPSQANFLLVRMKPGVSGGGLCEELLRRHAILIKDISGKFADGRTYLRFAVRLPQENMRLVAALAKAGAGAAG